MREVDLVWIFGKTVAAQRAKSSYTQMNSKCTDWLALLSDQKMWSYSVVCL